MRLFGKILFGLVSLLVVVVVITLATAPLSTPWRAMLQQLSLLPDWLQPESIDAERVGVNIRTPEGYRVTLFAQDIFDARGLRVSRAGDVLVSVPGKGQVLLLERDADGDGSADGRRVILAELRRPYGLDFYDGYLYVGEEDALGRIAFDHEAGTVSGEYERVVTGLPAGAAHWRNAVRFGPDGVLYTTSGSSCNVCIEEDERRASMLRFTPDGEYLGIYATGLRNAVGFDWSPDGKLYATDNGRDLLGDDFPPCELNEIVAGGFYGWPFANGAKIPDPDFGVGREEDIARSLPPVHEFRAHNAPLGMEFLRSDRHPTAYRNAALVALHGSWNRTVKDGYKVVSLHFAADGSIEERDFLWGFLRPGGNPDVIGRPAEIAEAADGTIYVSDDYGGAVYRVTPEAGTDSGQLSVPGAAGLARASLGYTREELSADERDMALRDGAAAFERSGCVECHGDAGAGAGGLKALQGLAERYTLAELDDYLGAPNPPMPAFTGSAENRRLIAIYLLETH